MSQFGYLDQMQEELRSQDPSTPIRILGVNEAGQESGNAVITRSLGLPWLQETAAARAWSAWEVELRDLVVLDRRNARVRVYNLTSHNLGERANYDELMSILKSAAAEP